MNSTGCSICKGCTDASDSDSPFGKWVLIQIGTIHIDMLLSLAMEKELDQLGRAWDRG